MTWSGSQPSGRAITADHIISRRMLDRCIEVVHRLAVSAENLFQLLSAREHQRSLAAFALFGAELHRDFALATSFANPGIRLLQQLSQRTAARQNQRNRSQHRGLP